VSRDDTNNKWQLEMSEGGKPAETLLFDKIVMAAGPHNVPIQPTIPGNEQFEGEILHSIAFKDPAQYKGKNVVVLGMGNTAVDTATILVGHAKTIHLAHRNGCVLLPRILNDGTSLDHGASYRTFGIRDTLEVMFPKLAANFIDNWVRQIQDKHFNLKPEWRINTPTPSLSKQNPTVSDTLYPALKAGEVQSTHSIKRFTGSHTLELEDGTVLSNIDIVVLCTGYRLDLSYLGPNDPCDMTPNADGPHQYDYNCPRLYRNLLSHEHPDSLAFVGLALLFFPAFTMADLTSQALAQLWKHPEHLPSQAEMQEQYAKHRAWRARINAQPKTEGKGPQPLQLETGEQLAWVQKMAGTRLDEHLSYTSLEAWKLWWRDPKLSKMLMDGIYSPHAYRLFDSPGKRKKWDGARRAIEKVNEDVKKRIKDGGLLAVPGDVVVQS
jgi:dimethylaniline monooxygenase (N-oxide forming)